MFEGSPVLKASTIGQLFEAMTGEVCPVSGLPVQFTRGLQIMKNPYVSILLSLITNPKVIPFQLITHRLLDSLVVLTASAGGPGLNPQGPRHTKDVIKIVLVVFLSSTQTLKREILALS